MDFLTKNKVLFWCVVVLVLLNVVMLTTFCLGRPSRGPKRPGNGQGIMQERLQLSSEQAEQFEEIRDAHFARTKPLQDDMYAIQMNLLEEVFAAEADEAKTQALLAELGAKHVEFQSNLYQHFRELKTACNEDQVEALRITLSRLVESARLQDPRRPTPGSEGKMPPGHQPPPGSPDGMTPGHRPPRHPLDSG